MRNWNVNGARCTILEKNEDAPRKWSIPPQEFFARQTPRESLLMPRDFSHFEIRGYNRVIALFREFWLRGSFYILPVVYECVISRAIFIGYSVLCKRANEIKRGKCLICQKKSRSCRDERQDKHIHISAWLTAAAKKSTGIASKRDSRAERGNNEANRIYVYIRLLLSREVAIPLITVEVSIYGFELLLVNKAPKGHSSISAFRNDLKDHRSLRKLEIPQKLSPNVIHIYEPAANVYLIKISQGKIYGVRENSFETRRVAEPSSEIRRNNGRSRANVVLAYRSEKPVLSVISPNVPPEIFRNLCISRRKHFYNAEEG